MNTERPEGTARITELRVEQWPGSIRLDTYLREQLTEVSRQTIQRLIREGRVLVDGRRVKPTYQPRVGQTIIIYWPEPRPTELIPREVPYEVLFEDAWILVINKPAGLAVHPSPGHEEESLVHGLLFRHGDQLSGIGGELRPGIVHRLDVGTSGVLVVAKNDEAHRRLSEQFVSRRTQKVYDAIVCRIPNPENGMIVAPIGRHPVQRKKMAVLPGGREASTEYRIREGFGEEAAWVEVHPRTGRTHQIRVHMKHVGCPLFGDMIYGERANRKLSQVLKWRPERPMLHARRLGFFHPKTGKWVEFEAPWPVDFQEAIERLRRWAEGKGGKVGEKG